MAKVIGAALAYGLSAVARQYDVGPIRIPCPAVATVIEPPKTPSQRQKKNTMKCLFPAKTARTRRKKRRDVEEKAT